MSLLNTAMLGSLQDEFRRSMRRLLRDLSQDLGGQYAGLAARLGLPAGFFLLIARAFDEAEYSNWKVVGWIEALNDLIYFLDVLVQIKRERNRRIFAEQFFIECEQKFFENSYVDELFPQGRIGADGLEGRLHRLCRRQALEIIQESLFFDPRWPIAWVVDQNVRKWEVPASLDSSFERAERAGTVSIGTNGAAIVAPRFVIQALIRPRRRATWVVSQDDIALRLDRCVPVCSRRGHGVHWHWPLEQVTMAKQVMRAGRTASESLIVGPTLHYGSNRQPKRLSSTERHQVMRIARASGTIRRAWPEGHAVLMLLTRRIIPLKARGVVSFSYRHRPGLSFVNCFHRDNLDLIDDLIHENSHHHLNLLLRKHELYRGDRNEQVFYSPWRRSLRPIRGILHATFTFTMGALLFERLSSWAESKQGPTQWRRAGLTGRDLLRTRFRCFEEIESVHYSLRDLEYAGRHLKWITAAGARVIGQLEAALVSAERRMSRHRETVLASRYGPTLRKHISELRLARQTYGPIQRDQA